MTRRRERGCCTVHRNLTHPDKMRKRDGNIKLVIKAISAQKKNDEMSTPQMARKIHQPPRERCTLIRLLIRLFVIDLCAVFGRTPIFLDRLQCLDTTISPDTTEHSTIASFSTRLPTSLTIQGGRQPIDPHSLSIPSLSPSSSSIDPFVFE